MYYVRIRTALGAQEASALPEESWEYAEIVVPMDKMSCSGSNTTFTVGRPAMSRNLPLDLEDGHGFVNGLFRSRMLRG